MGFLPNLAFNRLSVNGDVYLSLEIWYFYGAGPLGRHLKAKSMHQGAA